MTEQPFEQGAIASCSVCGRTRWIRSAVVELFGHRVGFGPGGERDMFIEGSDGEIECLRCVEASLEDLDDSVGDPVVWTCPACGTTVEGTPDEVDDAKSEHFHEHLDEEGDDGDE